MQQDSTTDTIFQCWKRIEIVSFLKLILNALAVLKTDYINPTIGEVTCCKSGKSNCKLDNVVFQSNSFVQGVKQFGKKYGISHQFLIIWIFKNIFKLFAPL